MSQSKPERPISAVEISAGRRGIDEPRIDSFYKSVGLRAPGRIRRQDEFRFARDGDEVVGILMYWLTPDP